MSVVGQLCKLGLGFGYFPNSTKSWLVFKDRYHSEAEIIFAGTNVKLTNDEWPYLGSANESSLHCDQVCQKGFIHIQFHDTPFISVC